MAAIAGNLYSGGAGLSALGGGGAAVAYGGDRRTYWIASTQTESADPLSVVVNGDGSYTTTVPTRSDAATLDRRRCEVEWGWDNRIGRVRAGERVSVDFDCVGTLGEAGQDPVEWHVISQMHGPCDDGVWRPPCISVVVSDGYWHLRGGSGQIGSVSTANGNFGWQRNNLVPWVDGRRYHIDLQLVMGNEADGRITFSINGTTYVNNWIPQGEYGGQPTGKYPGTLYGHPHTEYGWTMVRTGLYRGSNDDTPPTTYPQTITITPRLIGTLRLP